MKSRTMMVLSYLVVATACGGEPTPADRDAAAATTPTALDVVRVRYEPLDATVVLPGELVAFESVELHARAEGFVRQVDVDRGSIVHAGDVLVQLSAPELRAQREGVEARLRGQHSTSERLRVASATPGAVAGHDLEIATADEGVTDAQARSLATLQSYLVIRAPFDGVITERFVHPGALVGPSGDHPLVRLEQVARLRLVVPVPEYAAGHVVVGTGTTFHVGAFPGRAFTGHIAREAHSVDTTTRTMPVELDVDNADGALAPGMYADVSWHVTREAASYLVPPRAIVQTTSAIFVVVVRDGHVLRVPVERGMPITDFTEVFGELHADDVVLARGREDLPDGQAVTTHVADGAPAAH